MACSHDKGRWPLVRRLRWLRVLQYVLNAVIIAISAYLISFLNSNDGNLGGAATVPVIVAPLTFILTVLQQWFGTHLSGYRKRWCLIFFIFFDLTCIGLQVPLIAVLAVAGLPANCDGVANGLDSSIFGNSGHGLSKRYCAVPNASFWLSIILMLLYVYSMSLIIRQIVAVSREAKLLKEEQRVSDSNERVTAIMAAHQAPPRNTHRSRHHQTETVDLRDESVRNVQSRDGSSVAGEEPPPYINDEEHGMAKNLKKN